MSEEPASAFAVYNKHRKQKKVTSKKNNAIHESSQKKLTKSVQLKRSFHDSHAESDQSDLPRKSKKKRPTMLKFVSRATNRLINDMDLSFVSTLVDTESKSGLINTSEESDSEIPILVPIGKNKRKRIKRKPKDGVLHASKCKPEDSSDADLNHALINTAPQGEESDEEIPVLVPIGKNKRKIKRKPKDDVLHTSKCKPEEDSLVVSENLLRLFLMPVKSSTFFEKYWEKEPLHVKRNNSDHFQHILTSKKLDSMLREHPLYYTRNVDIVKYENGVRQTYNPEGRAVASCVWDYYASDCSVRILNPQTYCRKIHLILTTLQEYFGTMVGANVYLTPPGSQGFAPHYDDIEAFVLQLEGRKHWKIYEPRSDSEKLPRHSSPNFARNELGDPLMEVTVEQGDLLYFPRGFIHEAHTDEDAHSLHITISVYQNTAYVDLLEKLLPEALKMAVKNDIEFREGLPLNYLKHLGAVNLEHPTNLRQEIVSKVDRLIKKLAVYAPVDWAADEMGRKLMYDSLPPILTISEKNRSSANDGETLEDGRLCNRVEFELTTMVKLVRYHSMRVVIESETSAKIYYCTENANVYHGEEEQSLDIDLQWMDVIKTLMRKYPNYVSIESLPSDNDEMKMQVVNGLWERGLIITREPLPAFE